MFGALITINAVAVYWLVYVNRGVDRGDGHGKQFEVAAGTDERWLRIRLGADPSIFAAVREAPRAIVFLRVKWSVVERVSRQDFLDAASQLSDKHPNLNVEFFLVDEESELSQEWLASFHSVEMVPVGCGGPIGAGSILWLEKGRLVKFEMCGPKASEIVKRSLLFWGSGA